MRVGARVGFVVCVFSILISLPGSIHAGPAPQSGATKFEISFPAAAHADAITGRVFVMISKKDTPEPRMQAGGYGDTSPIFASDVSALAAGQTTVIDGNTQGYPLRSLRDIPAGDYYVQALMNIYTEFHRADGHTIWAHMDQWEGQHFARSPGNIYSEVQKVHLDPGAGYAVKFSLTKVIPAVTVPADTAYVKHIKIQSDMLTKFWGHPMFIGAVVLLPKGYDVHPDAHYPVIYDEGHFSLGAPFGFTPENEPVPDAMRARLSDVNRETGYEFYQSWTSDSFPRMIAVTFQHPTPYFDDSYAVNSANNGPYGDALVKEMIPYLESHFRMIPKAYARVLTGGSTGGGNRSRVQVYLSRFFWRHVDAVSRSGGFPALSDDERL